MKISNPVLTGFHADPSMIRVGDTYYIALPIPLSNGSQASACMSPRTWFTGTFFQAR